MQNIGGTSLQALVANTSSWTPDAVDAVAAKDSNWVTAAICGACEAEPAFVTLQTSVCEKLLRAGFNLACVFENKSICPILVKRSAPFHRLKTDDASMMGEERVDPPPVEDIEVSRRGENERLETHDPARNPKSPTWCDCFGAILDGHDCAHRFKSAW